MNLWPFSGHRSHPSCEAVAADEEATRALTDAKSLTCRADQVADSLTATRQRNHFAAAVISSFQGGRP